MKMRNDFVSNSSSSSFVIRLDEDYGIFRNDAYSITWQNYCDSYDGLYNDCVYYLMYGYKYDYINEHKKPLIELISFKADNEFVEFWKNNKDCDIEKVFPESCKEMVLSIIPLCQEIAEIYNACNLNNDVYKQRGKRRIELEDIVSKKLINEILLKYKEVLEPHCKDMKFLVASYSDHNPGWAGEDDAESAMRYTLRNSKCKFQRIWSEH